MIEIAKETQFQTLVPRHFLSVKNDRQHVAEITHIFEKRHFFFLKKIVQVGYYIYNIIRSYWQIISAFIEFDANNNEAKLIIQQYY